MKGCVYSALRKLYGHSKVKSPTQLYDAVKFRKWSNVSLNASLQSPIKTLKVQLYDFVKIRKVP